MKFAHHQVCKRPQEATAATTTTTTSSDDDLHELEKLIKCSSHISSEDAAEARRLANNVERQRRGWQLYVVVCLGLCVGGLLLVYAAASNSLLLVSTKPRHHHHLASEDQNGPGHAHSSSAPNYYSIQPDGVNNVIECALREREGEGGRTLFIVINSRAQNFERRRKLRASWLNAPNLRRELCRNRRPRELGRPSSSGSAAGAPPTEPNADASINQSNRALAHKARINRIEWLFALGHVRADQDLTSSGEHKEVAILGRERGQFNDLLMLPLVDSYRNMTLKHLAIFEWLLGRQQNQEKSIGRSQSDQAATSSIKTTTTTTTPLLIKADDDAQLDLAQMISKYVIETTGHALAVRNPRPLLMCARFEAGTPVTRYHRDGTGSGNKTSSNQMNENKWALTRSEWPEDTFPAYCSGLAYLATLDLIEALKKAAARNRRAPLWIDDVYLTGVLLGRLPRNSHRIIKLNSYYCYTRAQKLHRESLEPGLRCMAYEDREA